MTDLEAHKGLLYTNRSGDWRFAKGSGWTVVRPRAALRVNNGIVMRDAALAGLGLAMLPTFFVHHEIVTGALVEVDIGWAAEGAELFLTYPRDHGVATKIRAFRDSLRRNFGDPPYWETTLIERQRSHFRKGEQTASPDEAAKIYTWLELDRALPRRPVLLRAAAPSPDCAVPFRIANVRPSQ